MSQICEGRRKAWACAAAIAKNLRVKLDVNGKLAVCGAGAADDDLGTMENATFAAGDIGTVNLRTAQGTMLMVASGAITAGKPVYGDAGGKVSATVSGQILGYALEAATANNDVIEVLRTSGLKVAYGVLATVTAADTVVTGLNTVVAAFANLESDASINPLYAQAEVGDQVATPAAGSIFIKTWQATDATHTTPIAATTFAKKVSWLAIGT